MKSKIKILLNKSLIVISHPPTHSPPPPKKKKKKNLETWRLSPQFFLSAERETQNHTGTNHPTILFLLDSYFTQTISWGGGRRNAKANSKQAPLTFSHKMSPIIKMTLPFPHIFFRTRKALQENKCTAEHVATTRTNNTHQQNNNKTLLGRKNIKTISDQTAHVRNSRSIQRNTVKCQSAGHASS